jgi:hypothetical protein
MSARQDRHWNPDYQKRDWNIVDYQEWGIPGVSDRLRGPAIDLEGTYFTCIGAAQTHGTFVERPFAQLLSDALGIQALNLGQPAASPGFFAANDEVIKLINKGRFAIVQVMSARAEGNSRYAPEGYCETLRDRETGDIDSSWAVWSMLLEKEPACVPQLILESQRSLLDSYRKLIERIEVPVMILYISHERGPNEFLDLDSLDAEKLYFHFPQITDGRVIPEILALGNASVSSESKRNYNHLLVNRFTGAPTFADNSLLHPSGANHPKLTHNAYYPSQEMHEDAAKAILAELVKLEWV